MTLIIHKYTVLLATQEVSKDGYKYEKIDVDLKELTKDELEKLYLETQSVEARLLMEISDRENTPIVDTPSTGSIAGAES